MKRNLLILGILIFLLSSCLDNRKEEIVKIISVEEKDFETVKFRIKEKESAKDFYIDLKTLDSDGTYEIEWGNEKSKWIENLMEMTENRGYRMPPNYRLETEDYLCLITNWSGPYSEHVFLPKKENLKSLYYKEDIDYIDEEDSFIIKIKADNNKTYWEIESLKTKEREKFEIPIYEGSGSYPFYKELRREGNEIHILPQGRKAKLKKVNIKKFCT